MSNEPSDQLRQSKAKKLMLVLMQHMPPLVLSLIKEYMTRWYIMKCTSAGENRKGVSRHFNKKADSASSRVADPFNA